MNLRQTIFALFILIISSNNLLGQCNVTLGTVIEDVSSGSIDVFVEGVLIDDLSNPNQGLCGVELFFEHTSLQDVSISLESPGGQQVTLVGPATGAGGNTQFTYWGIEFVPCDSTANPDLPILDSIFTTEDNWGIFGNFSGAYYPQLGCLEDFNTGTVNGLWTLNFEDVQNFDIGSIDSVGLIFCDDSNVQCLECLADGAILPDIISDYCESDPNLDLDINPIYNGDTPGLDYDYNYIIVQDSEVASAVQEPNLIGFASGSYQVCGLSTIGIQTQDVLDDVVGNELSQLNDLFADNNYCADLSNCLEIITSKIRHTILTTDTICFGDAIILDGTEYTETGEYVISFSQAFCDSVSILDLLVINNKAEIIADSDVISCSDGDVVLDASSSITSPSTIRSWFRVDGFLDPSIESDVSITVTEAGTYGLSLITGICADTVYFQVENDDSIPSFEFEFDTLNCYNPSVLIDMTPSIPLQSVIWSGPETGTDEDISVLTDGTYYIEGIATNGCSGNDSVLIVQDIQVPEPIFVADTLTCIDSEITIETILPDSLTYSYNWSGPNILSLASNSNIEVAQDTIYTLTLQNIENGCVEDFFFNVEIDTNKINYEIESTPISCISNSSIVSVSPINDNTVYEWRFNQSIVGIGDTLIANQLGEYELIVTPSNGCIDTFFHTVIENFDTPIVSVDDVTLDCLMDSIQLISTTSETDIVYEWIGPGAFESNEPSPFVSTPGIYRLEAIKPSGCNSFILVNVFPGEGTPEVTFFPSDTLSCSVDVITLTPSDTFNLVFAWQNSSVIEDTTAYVIEARNRGIASVIITDTISGCSALFDVRVPGDLRPPIPTVERLSLDCDNEMVILSTTFEVELDSLRWTSDFGFNSIEQSPEVTQSGDYYITAVGINGCTYTDTITLSENFNLPQITTNVEGLDCINNSAEISFQTDSDTDILSIRLPTGEEIFQNSLTVSEPNTYVAIAETASGCIDSVTMVVIQDTTAINAMLVTSGNINCADSTVTIFVESDEQALSYDWFGGSIISPPGLDSIIVDSIGSYSVTIVDTSNCIRNLEIDVTLSLDSPIVSYIADTITCIQEFANIKLEVPDDFLSITWDGPSVIENNITDFTVDVAGTYMANVTGSNNCITIEPIVVEIDTLFPLVQIISSGILDCDTELVTLIGNSNITGSSIEWSNSNDINLSNDSIAVNEPGIYNLLVTAPNQCQIDTFFNVELDTISPTINTSSIPVFSCSDGKVAFEIETTTEIVEYVWEGPLDFESDLEDPLAVSPGLYSVTVINDRGCSASLDIDVIEDNEGPEIMVRDTFITCDQLPITLPLNTEEEDVSFAWEAPNFTSDLQNPETNVLGEYIVFAVLERNECVTIDTVNVTFELVPPIYDVDAETLNCMQSEATLSAIDVDDDLSAIWTDIDFNVIANDSITVSDLDSFYLIVTGQNTCSDTTKVVVDEDFEEVGLEIFTDNQSNCNNTDLTLLGNVLDFDSLEDFSASWSTTGGTIENGEDTFEAKVTGEGKYFLSVLNSTNGCLSLDSITIELDSQSLVGLSLEGNDPSCFGFQNGSITIMNVEGGVSPFQYSINGENQQTEDVFTDLSANNYSIQVIDDLGCTFTTQVELNDGLDFVATAEGDTTIVVGDEVDLLSFFNVPDEEIESITWSGSDDAYSCDDCFEAPVSPLFNTLYTLEATTNGGCVDTSQVFIKVIRNPKISVANVFVPGSELNGLFYIQQTSGIEKVLSMSIFDKWASRMYFVEDAIPGDPSAGWDGTYKGADVNPGVYVYVAQLLLYSGEVITYAGDITLLR